MLISYASCSPALWSGWSDGALPFDAQGSAYAVGTQMNPAPGSTWRPAHGIKYGPFCHSDITSSSDANHAAAVSAAKKQILDWLFMNAPRVTASGSVGTPTIAYNQSTTTYNFGSTCTTWERDEGVEADGVCYHPGYFDGDDHAIASSEITLTNGSTCNGSFRWTQRHDSSNSHAAGIWWKARSVPYSTNLVGTFPAN